MKQLGALKLQNEQVSLQQNKNESTENRHRLISQGLNLPLVKPQIRIVNSQIQSLNKMKLTQEPRRLNFEKDFYSEQGRKRIHSEEQGQETQYSSSRFKLSQIVQNQQFRKAGTSVDVVGTYNPSIFSQYQHYQLQSIEKKLSYQQEKCLISSRQNKFRNKTIFNRIKLKRSFLCIFFITIVQNLSKISKQKKHIKLKTQLKECKQELQQYSLKYRLYQKKTFIQNVANKILMYIKTEDYIKQCENLGLAKGVDFRKTNITNITKLFYQNLELMTRENNLLKYIQSEIIIQLFYNSKRTTTFFVGSRCYFYNNQITHIPKDQKLAIALEFFFFQYLLPNILSLTNDIQYESLKYQTEVFNNFLIIPSLFQKLFVSKFYKLKKLQSPNGNMKSQKFKLSQLNENGLLFEIIESDFIGNPNFLIEGLIDYVVLENLEQEKPYWKNHMQLLFNKICQNFESIINL